MSERLTRQDVAEAVAEALDPVNKRLDSIDQRLANIETEVRTIKSILKIEEQVENLMLVRGQQRSAIPNG